MGFAGYLGQACPIIAPMVGRYSGRNGKRLDMYGMNLSADTLPGQGHRALHDQLKHMMVSMMKVAGVQANVEAANFLTIKLGNLTFRTTSTTSQHILTTGMNHTPSSLISMHITSQLEDRGLMIVEHPQPARQYLKSRL